MISVSIAVDVNPLLARGFYIQERKRVLRIHEIAQVALYGLLAKEHDRTIVFVANLPVLLSSKFVDQRFFDVWYR